MIHVVVLEKKHKNCLTLEWRHRADQQKVSFSNHLQILANDCCNLANDCSNLANDCWSWPSLIIIFSDMKCIGVIGFYVFLENDSTNLRQCFSGFKRKHLFITTCCEKHCTGPL